ncbi:MAG TPA: imidazole glycerol phosphate synthase subunit HisH [Caulobacteraceae bacterium]|jgi:glutamine amidotransferase
MRSVALVDYGSGNLPSALKALRRAAEAVGDTRVEATDDPETISRADAVVLPGVGAFAACMDALRARAGVIEAMEAAVRHRGAPFLGICVGLQLMADQGREFGLTPGLGWVGGEVRRLAPSDPALKLPHMGWNSIDRPHGPLFSGLANGDHMYFTHAYAIFPENEGVAAGWTDHGGTFVSAVTSGNLAGVQFHPEKSQDAGALLLRNFLEWRP